MGPCSQPSTVRRLSGANYHQYPVAIGQDADEIPLEKQGREVDPLGQVKGVSEHCQRKHGSSTNFWAATLDEDARLEPWHYVHTYIHVGKDFTNTYRLQL